jgi:hypothetical protein
MDVSILIVHYNTPELLRQTLRGILKAAPRVKYEVVVVDNNPNCSVNKLVADEFPEARLVEPGENVGFGPGMNLAMEEAKGRYYMIFNPDVVLHRGALEEMVDHMDQHDDIGILGPQLRHPNGELQHSCYRFMEPKTVAYRRIPLLRALPSAREHINDYLMADWDHEETRDVDYLLGAVMFTRREAIEEVGKFDENYFMYFEDQDLCRRFWKAGWRVVYHPGAVMRHYHRRETAHGSFIDQLRNPLTRIQLESALYYYKKYRGEENPRLTHQAKNNQ